MTAVRQLSLDDLLSRSGPPPAPEPPADDPPAAEAAPVESASPDEPALFDVLMEQFNKMNELAEANVQKMREIHAQVLGCQVEELDARVAAEAAERKAQIAARAERPAPTRSKRSSRASKRTEPSVEPAAPPTAQLDDRQRELLSFIRVNGNVAVFARDERIPDWDALKRVMVALGGKWRARRGFVFPADVDAAEAVRLAIETGEVLDPVAAGFFPTPHELARHVVRLAEIGPGDLVLEPSAGRGAIARAAREAGGAVVCSELLPNNALALCEDGFRVFEGDFLSMTPTEIGRVDRVVMNPPFGKRADIAHVRHALSFLRRGGRLVAIMGAGVEFRDDALARDFRALVATRGGRIERNPDGSFLASGTGVRTVTVVMEGEA